MSALDPTQGTLGTVYCASANIVSEIVNLQQFNPGDDSTGVGTKDNPYETPEQACKEIRLYEGQAETTKIWRVCMISANGQIGSYPRFNLDAGTLFPINTGGTPFMFIFAGYNKQWGVGTVDSKWDDVDDKPEWGGAASGSLRYSQYVDITIKTDVGNVFGQYGANGGSLQVYKCNIRRIVSTAAITSSRDATFMSCVFYIGVAKLSSGNPYYFVNCTFFIKTGFAMSYIFGGGAGNHYLSWLNCVFHIDGAGSFVVINTEDAGGFGAPNIIRTGNTYHLTNGASFRQDKEFGPALPFIPGGYGIHDVESQEVDPIFVSPDKAPLGNSSPVYDKGVALGGVFNTKLLDQTGEDKHLVDALGEKWGDSFGPENPVTANAESVFSPKIAWSYSTTIGYCA